MLPRWRWWVHFVHHCHCHCWPIVANCGHLKVSIQIVFGSITILFCFSCSSTVVGDVATPLQVGIREIITFGNVVGVGKHKTREEYHLIFSFLFPHSLLDEFVVRFICVLYSCKLGFAQSRCNVHVWMKILSRERKIVDWYKSPRNNSLPKEWQ